MCTYLMLAMVDIISQIVCQVSVRKKARVKAI